MPKVTHVDLLGRGHCTCHDEDVIVTFRVGAPHVKAANKQAGAVDFTIGRASCGHATIATMGSPNVFFHNKRVHRLDDIGRIGGPSEDCGIYHVITAHSHVFANEPGPASILFTGSTPTPPTPLGPAQAAGLANNIINAKQYKTPANIEQGVATGAEVPPPAVPPPSIDCAVDPMTLPPETAVDHPDIAALLSNVVSEANAGAWREGANNPNIIKLYADVGIPQNSDSVHWCAAFAGAILKRTCHRFVKTLRARDYEGYGTPVANISQAKRGDVVVFSRDGPPGSGHVGFFWGDLGGGRIQVIGGNQSNNVNVKQFSTARLLQIRRPVRS